ncbi:2-Hydroxyacid oxidase 1-like [Glandiceps talaboti]
MESSAIRKLVCLDDFEDYAKEHLSHFAWVYYSGAAGNQHTLKQNRKSFSRLQLMPRVLKNVSDIDLTSSVLGVKIDIPICISPTAYQTMASPEGVIATAKAASFHNTCMIVNAFTHKSIEEIASDVPAGLRWQNVYIWKRRDITKGLVERVEHIGNKAIVVTVDIAAPAPRFDMGQFDGFPLPSDLRIGSYAPYFDKDITTSGIQKQIKDADPIATWEDITWLKSITKLPIVLKGILSAADAKIAVQHGVDAIFVSNHGGRQLDTVPSTIEVLPDIVKAVGDKVEVYIDGGVRTGTDVLKALALGAKAVFIGRPVVYGLTYKGEDGVKEVLQILTDELKSAMALSGCRSISEITPSIVTPSTISML